MNRILKILFGEVKEQAEKLSSDSTVILTFDLEEIRCTRPNGKQESIRWSKLDAVLIETNDQAPISSDLFWLLLSKDLPSGCVIPQGAVGEGALLKQMQEILPGFDNETLIEAMSSTTNQRFLIWERIKS